MKRLFSLVLSAVLTGCGQLHLSGRSDPDHERVNTLANEDRTFTAQRPSSGQKSISIARPLQAPLEVDYVGRWNDPHGGFLVVTNPPRGGLILEFHRGGEEQRYPGSVTAEGLRFMRGNTAEAAILLSGGDGSEHGCLSVSNTETYCRS